MKTTSSCWIFWASITENVCIFRMTSYPQQLYVMIFIVISLTPNSTDTLPSYHMDSFVYILQYNFSYIQLCILFNIAKYWLFLKNGENKKVQMKPNYTWPCVAVAALNIIKSWWSKYRIVWQVSKFSLHETTCYL